MDFIFLEEHLPKCILLTKLIDHSIHSMSYQDSFLGNTYHDVKYLEFQLNAKIEELSMGEDFSIVTERIEELG